MILECSVDRPWGLHPIVRNDEDCPRCGWRAPGPRGDALANVVAAAAELDAAERIANWAANGVGGSKALAA